MTPYQKFQQRAFDLFFSSLGLLCFGWLILLAAVIAKWETKLSGFFVQQRVGKNGKIIKVYKIRSMKDVKGFQTSVTTDLDPRISKIGRFWRKSKIDELPQLWNVFVGDMSFVGPRPDVPGFADKLQGEDSLLLKVRPGITGPATIRFKNEEAILASQDNPEKYNREIIWPEKVKINLEYYQAYSLKNDIKILIETFIKKPQRVPQPVKPVKVNHPNFIEVPNKREPQLVSTEDHLI